jgi:hypothetical protein
VNSCSVTAKFEAQQPLAGTLARGCEAPLASSFAGNAIEVITGAGVIQAVTNDTTGTVDSYPDGHSDMTPDCVAGRGGDTRNFFVNRSTGSVR